MKQVNGKNPIFIKIESPLLIRKDLLKSALYATKILKDYRDFTHLKKEKDKGRSKLFKIFRETNKDIRDLKKSLPIIKKEKPKEEKEFKKPSTTKKTKTVTPKKELSETERLKKDLSSIEEKLKALEI